MPATCVPQYVPRANTGLSKHGDSVFPHFWSWNQNLARVSARGGGGVHVPGRPVLPSRCDARGGRGSGGGQRRQPLAHNPPAYPWQNNWPN